MENSTTPQKSNKTIIVLIIFALVALIGTAAFMMSRNEKDTEDKFLSIEQAKFKSDSLYTEMKKDLAFYKQNNEDLYAQIVEKEEELEKQYVKINRLIGQAQRDQASKKQIEAKLITLSKEISTLNEFVETQTKDIEELRVENKQLKAQKDSLAAAIKATAEQNKKLNNSTAQLSEENKKLSSQIEEASVLQIVNIKAAGLRTRNNGTRVGVAAAKRTEIIETCFDVVPNKVTKEGVNRFYLRLIDPSGFTLQDRGRGSGKITSVENERIDYTISKTFDYVANSRSICMEWESYPSTPFVSGTYVIKLYNNGRVVGTQNFSMK
jgi:uncharacterized protein YxeA